MYLRRHTMFMAALLLLVGNVMAQLPELTKADIPTDLPPDLRTLIEKTFSDKTIGPSSIPEKYTAVEGIGKMQERAAPAVPFLIRLLDDSDMYFDDMIGDALVAIGEPAVEPLITAGKHSKEMRGAPIQCLGKLKDKFPRALDAIIEFLQDSDWKIRKSAAIAFKGSDDPRAVLPLIELLGERGEDYIRRSAADCFCALHDPRAVEPLLKLAESKGSENECARRAAITALGYQRDKRAVPTLLKIFSDSKNDPYDRREAAMALGRIGDKSVFIPIINAVWDVESPFPTRKGAIHAAVMYHDEETVAPVLFNLFLDERTPFKLKIEIVKALAEYGDPSNTKCLLGIRDYNGRNRLAFWAAMGAVKLSDGAIDDEIAVRVIKETKDYDEFGNEMYIEEKREALHKIAANGTTLRVRQAAKEQEEEEEQLLTSDYVVVGVIVVIAMIVWFIIWKCYKPKKVKNN